MNEYGNRYKVMLPVQVGTEDATYGQGDEFEKQFSAVDEAANVASGLLEIVPCEWKVIGDSSVHETAPGESFEAALSIADQEFLVGGGFVEKVEQKKAPPAAPKASRSKKAKEE